MEIIDRTTISTDAGNLECCVWKQRDAEGKEEFAISQNLTDGTPYEPIGGWVGTPEQAIENMIEECEDDDDNYDDEDDD